MQRHVLDTADVDEYRASLARRSSRREHDGDGSYTADEMMAVEAARRLARRRRSASSASACRASPRTSPGARTRPAACWSTRAARSARSRRELPLSIGDGELAETADAVVSVPEMFAYWLQGGRIDVGFLGAAQIDRHGNLNSTVIGDYDAPEGAPARRRRRARDRDSASSDVFVMLRQSPRAFVERLDFTTSVGDNVRVVVTDLGILEPRDGELTLVAVHPGVDGRGRARRDRLGAAGRRRRRA